MILTPLEFLRRFEPQERIAIRAAHDPVIEDGLHLLSMADHVDTEDQDTVRFVNYLVSQGLLTQAGALRVLVLL